VVAQVLKDFKGPIGWGLRSGHLADYRQPGVTLPIGAEVALTVGDDRMSLRATTRDTASTAS
jgi:hypothetical protein